MDAAIDLPIGIATATNKMTQGGINISENALKVLEKRYFKKNEKGEPIEDAEGMFRRVANAVAVPESLYGPEEKVREWAERFYGLLSSFDFMPNSPTLMNAGNTLGQLSACFVIPVEDSTEGIFDAVKYAALVNKSGGGTGFSFSRLRPKNDAVLSTHGIASGPLSFMRIFDTATDVVKQGGTRRGANMGVLRVDHPDIMEFIAAKTEDGLFANFNFSVGITDAFMKAVEAGTSYDLVNPRTGEVTQSLDAGTVFEKIVTSAWRNGEPGVIFLDAANRANPTPHIGLYEATNPCGETPLLPWESCNLGSINLGNMVRRGRVDYDHLMAAVHTAVRFLDNVIDANRYPLPQIEEMTKRNRKIGLGVMGFADLLVKVGIAYDSQKAIDLADEVMAFIQRESKRASAALGEKRGNFPAYPGSVYDRPETPFMRNATTTTIAPTGTISIIADASSGIEPIFALSYERWAMEKDEKMHVLHPLFRKVAAEHGFGEEILKRAADEKSIQGIDEIPAKIRHAFKTAHDVSPHYHVEIQAAFQRHTDNAVSKTINFPSGATVDEVREAYLDAFEMGCKGLTVYRDGSREHQVLGTQKESKSADSAPAPEPKPFQQVEPRPRPDATIGVTQRISTGCGKLYVTVNSDEYGVCEVFAQMGKTGGCAQSQVEAVGRLASIALRSGVKIEAIINELAGIRCPSPCWHQGAQVYSCSDAIAKALAKKVGVHVESSETTPATCPDCGSTINFEEGCLVCKNCGFSKCG